LKFIILQRFFIGSFIRLQAIFIQHKFKEIRKNAIL
jgi:hypothetical protein